MTKALHCFGRDRRADARLRCRFIVGCERVEWAGEVDIDALADSLPGLVAWLTSAELPRLMLLFCPLDPASMAVYALLR